MFLFTGVSLLVEYFVFLWVLPSATAAWIASSKGRSATGIFFLSMVATPLIGLLVAVALSPAEGDLDSRHRSKRDDDDDADSSFTVTISTSYDDDLYDDELRANPATAADCWVPPGTSVTVHGYEITDGMVYVGRNLPSGDGWNAEPALINPGLDVEDPSRFSEHEVDYWPAFNRITPQDRGAYLMWLAGGRRDRICDIRYVFLFFYGLERRAVVDVLVDPSAKRDIPAIRAEVDGLLSVYGEDGSFHGYAGRFLDFLDRSEIEKGPIWAPPKNLVQGWELPESIRIPIGRMSRDGIGLPAEWALTWLRCEPELRLRTPATRCTEEFDKLFILEFERRYPDGLQIKPCKRKIKVQYHPAGRSLDCSHTDRTLDVPDVTSLVGPRRKLQAIAEWCQDELDAYSRWLGRHADEKGTLSAAAVLPQDLLTLSPPAELKELKTTITQAIGTNPLAAVPALEILRGWLPDDGSKQRKKAAVEGARLLDRIGIGVEPDVRFGGRALTRNDEVVVFRLAEGDSEVASPQYGAAAVLVHLAAMVSAADGEVTEREETLLKDRIAEGLHLTRAEQRRLSAYLHWLIRNPPTATGLKKKLEVIPTSQRETIGRFLVSVAWADGHVDPEEVRSLAKIYRTLGLERDAVHQHIHDIHAERDTSPVTVVPGEEGKTYKIPQEKAQGVELDRRKIATMQKESLEVSRIMGEIFDDEPDTQADDRVSESVGTIGGLDQAHSILLTKLGERESWDRGDFEALVETYDLFPDGALEILNEVAYDVCDEPLTDGEDPIVINQDVYQEVAG